MQREEPKFTAEELEPFDLDRPPRRRVESRAESVDWRLVWSIVLALAIWRVIEAIGAVVLARLALWRVFGV